MFEFEYKVNEIASKNFYVKEHNQKYNLKEIIKIEMKVKDNLARVMRVGDIDYISLTDLAKYQNEDDPSGVIRNWMSNKNSFDFYNLWEELHNENFSSVESHRIKIDEVGYNRFTMTPNSGKRTLMLLELFQVVESIVLGHLHIQILHLNLLVG